MISVTSILPVVDQYVWVTTTAGVSRYNTYSGE